MENDKNLDSAKEETILKMANKLGLDKDMLLQAAMKVSKVELEQRQRSALKFFRKKK